MATPTSVPLTQLRAPCDPAQFKFKTTNDLPDLTEMVGQARAIEAVEFAIGMNQPGYNLFVLGPPGTGRHSFVKRFLGAKAAEQPAPADWCYVNNFDKPREPIALELPAGRGRQLCRDLDRLVDEASTAIPTAFESDEYRERRQAIEKAFGAEQARRFQALQKRAAEKGIAIIRTQQGIAFAPLKDDGGPMSPEEIQQLPEDAKEKLGKASEELGEEVAEVMQTMPHLVREARERVHELDRQVAMLAGGSLIDELLAKYNDVPKVAAYLRSLQSDIIDNFVLFLGTPEMQPGGEPDQPHQMVIQQPRGSPAKKRYCANLIVDHSSNNGLPVVAEDHPSYPNLVGEVEYLARMGALETNYSMIHAGALHKANGGYLILDALKVLGEPYAWQGLKQALRAREVRIESLGRSMGMMPTASLEPEPISLDVKVVLIGDRSTYYQLQALDPEFLELFKVAADFDDQMVRDDANNMRFAELLGTIARQENLLPLDPTGVARLIEESSRHAEHSAKLSAQIRRAADLMREANYWAEKDADGKVDGADIQCAIDKRMHRSSRIKERMQEAVLDQSILIATDGEAIGQINGLAVMQVGDFAFARPSRITARVALGGGKVVDIERETDLGGPLHSKGVLIISGYLAAKYAEDLPLSLSASIVMEQSYAGVDGDSASAAELAALLSALAEIPIKQSFGITGSINQHGHIQAIGGVNVKIEGFYDICKARGLTGDQGVIVPASNIQNLMLRQDVVDSVEKGDFQIHGIAKIEQALTLLTGLEAEEIEKRVRKRVLEFAERRRDFSKSGRSGDEKD